MSAETTVRAFQPDDGEAVIALWQEVLPSSQPWNDPLWVICRKLKAEDGLFFVAVQDGRIVGTVMSGYDGIRGWIYSLAVATNAQRHGIGRKLLAAAEQALLARGCPKVNLQVRATNHQVIDFYRRCGYDIEDRASLGKRLPVSDNRTVWEPVPTIVVRDDITLSQITWDDRAAYLRLLNETDLFRQRMGVMPYPYTEVDADNWLSKAVAERFEVDRCRSWAIREGRELIGGIGIGGATRNEKAEMGYWLAQSHWGRGIVTDAVRCLCRFVFAEYGLQRIIAHTFHINPASSRVLEKAGFTLEGTLRGDFYRDGQALDVRCYGLMRDELSSID